MSDQTKKRIAVLSGDGIGPEIMQSALRVLFKVGPESFQFEHADIGGVAYEKHGTHFPEQTRSICEASDAILFGAVGGPVEQMHLKKWENCEANSILALRKHFHFYANFRPVQVFTALAHLSPLKLKEPSDPIDILFVRELSGDIYFGEHWRGEQQGVRLARDVAEYSEIQIEAVAVEAFKAASNRRGKVTSVDKANVLATSRLWREVVAEVAARYPEIRLEHMLVDNCAMQLVLNPGQFDVVLTSNLFGDILSDAAAVLPGSLGLLSSASINSGRFGLYEPPAGSAPSIAGKGIANPIGQILSAALMLRTAFGQFKEAGAIEQAVSKAILEGARTKDISEPGKRNLSTQEMTEAILSYL